MGLVSKLSNLRGVYTCAKFRASLASFLFQSPNVQPDDTPVRSFLAFENKYLSTLHKMLFFQALAFINLTMLYIRMIFKIATTRRVPSFVPSQLERPPTADFLRELCGWDDLDTPAVKIRFQMLVSSQSKHFELRLRKPDSSFRQLRAVASLGVPDGKRRVKMRSGMSNPSLRSQFALLYTTS